MNYFDILKLGNQVQRIAIDEVERAWETGDLVEKGLLTTQLAVDATADVAKTAVVLAINTPIGLTRVGYRAVKHAVIGRKSKIEAFDEHGSPIEAELVK